MTTRVRTIPPFEELREGQLADYYEVVRDGKPTFVARDELSLDERNDIVDRLNQECSDTLMEATALDCLAELKEREQQP